VRNKNEFTVRAPAEPKQKSMTTNLRLPQGFLKRGHSDLTAGVVQVRNEPELIDVEDFPISRPKIRKQATLDFGVKINRQKVYTVEETNRQKDDLKKRRDNQKKEWQKKRKAEEKAENEAKRKKVLEEELIDKVNSEFVQHLDEREEKLRQEKLELLQIDIELDDAHIMYELVTKKNGIVMGSGVVNAQIMFIGDCPTKDEAELREDIPDSEKRNAAFQGRTYNFFMKGLDAVKIDPALHAWFTYVVKIRPPNVTENTGAQNSESRRPTYEEVREFLKALRTEIRIIKPKVIVCTGLSVFDFPRGDRIDSCPV
jgi:uracil-DNA glycosylase family 4